MRYLSTIQSRCQNNIQNIPVQYFLNRHSEYKNEFKYCYICTYTFRCIYRDMEYVFEDINKK